MQLLGACGWWLLIGQGGGGAAVARQAAEQGAGAVLLYELLPATSEGERRVRPYVLLGEARAAGYRPVLPAATGWYTYRKQPHPQKTSASDVSWPERSPLSRPPEPLQWIGLVPARVHWLHSGGKIPPKIRRSDKERSQ